LELEGLYTSSLHPIEDYFAFRESFLSLASALRLSVWQLEHLCAWYGNQRRNTNTIEIDEEADNIVPDEADSNPVQVNGIKPNEKETQKPSHVVLPDLLQQEKED